MRDDEWAKRMTSLGQRIRALREEQHLTQAEVARRAGIASFTYRKLENGESNPCSPANPRLRTLTAVSEVLGVSLEALLPPADAP